MNKLNYSHTFLILILCTFIAKNSFSITAASQNSKQLIVVIDPGHGGKDPGAINKNIREKDVVLGVGLKLGKLINENYPEVRVIFTRNTDVFIPLIDRSRIANKSKADLFISIHANICGTPSIRGTETFFLGPAREGENLEVQQKENSVIVFEEDYKTTYEAYDPNSAESQVIFQMYQSEYLKQSLYLAEAIQRQFKSRNDSPNRGVKQAGFLVLRMSSMPSVLVETGFLSNPSEANFLNSEEGQQHIALSILEAFRKFKSKRSGSVNDKTPEVMSSHQKAQDTLAKQVVRNENKKAEEKKKEEIVISAVDSEKDKPKKADTTSLNNLTKVAKTISTHFYSVQIGANTTPVEPVEINFKGLKNVRREKTDQYYRYYAGNENTVDKITSILKQIKLKFPQAFIVSFVDGKRIPIYAGSK